MGVRRRMKRTMWTDIMSNKDFLNRIKENRTVMDIIIKQKGNWLGHIIIIIIITRGNGILTTVHEGTVKGERRRKRKTLNFKILKE